MKKDFIVLDFFYILYFLAVFLITLVVLYLSLGIKMQDITNLFVYKFTIFLWMVITLINFFVHFIYELEKKPFFKILFSYLVELFLFIIIIFFMILIVSLIPYFMQGHKKKIYDHHNCMYHNHCIYCVLDDKYKICNL